MPRLDPRKVAAAIKESEGNKTLKRISDGQSLYLMVRNGRGYWSYSWRDGASFRTKLLGSAAMSPAKARIAREEEAAKRRNGIVIERRGAANRRLNPASADAAGKLFGDVVVEYLAKQAVNWTGGLEGKEAFSYRRSLTGNAFAMIPVADVATSDVEAALDKFTPGRSEKMRMRINKILDYATVKGYRTGDNPARLKGHFEHLPRPVAPKSEPHPSMPSAEVPKFMRELVADGSTEARALAFTILTAARTSETTDATWKEIEVGPAGAVWMVPKDRMKGKPEDRTEHRVPLCPAALKLLGKRGAPEDYIFPSRRYGARKPLWHASMLNMLKSLRGSVYVVHGFRATFSGDWAAKAGYPLELRERALHHAVGDSTLVAYNRDELVEQRRPMMTAWAKFIGVR